MFKPFVVMGGVQGFWERNAEGQCWGPAGEEGVGGDCGKQGAALMGW